MCSLLRVVESFMTTVGDWCDNYELDPSVEVANCSLPCATRLSDGTISSLLFLRFVSILLVIFTFHIFNNIY